MENVSIGLLGLGTVGSGVVHIIHEHQDKLQHQLGCHVEIKKILVKDMGKPRDIYLNGAVLTQDVNEIIDDPEIDVVIEVMGSVEDTKEYVKRALKNKKHIVTANKDMMALYGNDLLELAHENGSDFYYEASVAGGIPIIRSLVDGLASDKLTKLMGILNGTTNFILTKMSQEGREYEDVLQEAQALGFAEADPTSDVEGLDAARKLNILGALGFSMKIDLDDVSVRGISNVTKNDLEFCHQLGYTMKLIALAERTDGKVEVSVEPTLIPNEHPLATVNNEFNAIYVNGEAIGELMFSGPGAGSLPTATAVVSDLITVIKNMNLGVTGNSMTPPQFEKQLKSDDEIKAKYFIRLQAVDVPGTFAEITTLFGEQEISLEKVLQLPVANEALAEIVVTTYETKKSNFLKVLASLNDSPAVKKIKSYYRIEGDVY
ncbi:homoserine dehydrogenase [Fundicoccus culcitae]|uniref:Homoserine dehydrogenase n=1 Tax=Fundicoccus culcitae TaxID=2969821 RepID=A0ABY5P882_9LACT|nr:homoserine dehydrogenase [Fundicoccus culcitae]UUX34958.1 homoserine dehydrogenase [Fundicoccus culcitae]